MTASFWLVPSCDDAAVPSFTRYPRRAHLHRRRIPGCFRPLTLFGQRIGQVMWFQALSFVIATALLVKAGVALAIPGRFYATRQRHYASTSLPPALLVPPGIILCLTSVAWYATLVHYRPWGWLVTGFLTLLCSLSLNQLMRWRRHRETMLKVVANPKVWLIDCLLLVLGGGFAALGLLVY